LKFKIKILLLHDSIGIAVDQIYLDNISALTNYYFWPKTDAWKLIQLEIGSKDWLSKNEKIVILNRLTEILNSWKETQKY